MKALAPVQTLFVLAALVAAALLAGTQPAFADALEDAGAQEGAGEISIAADLYLVAWKASPDSRDAVVGLARTALAAKRADIFPLVEVALGRLIEKAGEADDAELRVALARILLFQVSCRRSHAQKMALALRARSNLERAVEVAPEDGTAVLLLAQAIDLSGEADTAVAAIDAFLDSGLRAPPALIYEKGRILYDQAVRRHADAGSGYPLPENVRQGFARARDLFYAAAVADASDFDAWIHLAWAAQRLGEFEDASLGYEKAMLLDTRSSLPLRGLHALYANDPPAFDSVLKRLLERHPEARQVLVFQGWRKLEADEIEEAERLIRLFVDQVPDDADGLHLLGRILTKKGQPEAAARFYWRAIEADPRHLRAAEEIDRLIRAEGLALAKQDRESLDRVRGEYQRLVEAAPDNPFVRNNVGFLLREAWLAHRKDPAWRDVADLAAGQYDAAVEAIGRWAEERGRTTPWQRRILYAQIVCDAGILRDNWPELADPVRAEFCFREALLWSEWGVLDAWTFLSKQYVHQGRDQDLYELALHCADGLKDAKGKPLAAERAKARAVAVRLETEGKVEGKVGQD